MFHELKEQMEPSAAALVQLRAAVEGKADMKAEVMSAVQQGRLKVSDQVSKNQAAAAERAVAQDEVRSQTAELREQVEGVRSGKKLEQARRARDHISEIISPRSYIRDRSPRGLSARSADDGGHFSGAGHGHA
jgi:hypothetical protein